MLRFTESDIRTLATPQSFSRGQSYYQSGAVSDLTLRGNRLTAQVAGSDAEPYRVTVSLDAAGGIASADCTCPYDWGGYCKHIVAVLLAALREPEVEVKPPLEALLADLTTDQLRSLLLGLADGHPELVEEIEEEVEALQAQPVVARPAAPVAYDLAAIRREILKDFRAVAAPARGDRYGRNYWDDDAYAIYPDTILSPHTALVYRLLDAGDAAAAAEVAETVIEAWIEGVESLEEWVIEANQDVLPEAARDLAVLLAEALLSQDLSEEDREEWLDTIEAWDDALVELDVVRTALEQGWDYPPLAAVLRGHLTEHGAWAEEPPDFADELAQVRLRILERQGRFEEYLYLAEAEGQLEQYVFMLARLGRVEEAVKEAPFCLTQPSQFLQLALILAEKGHHSAALQVAAAGLEKGEPWSRRDLARWTAEKAHALGDEALALAAAEAAFLSGYSLEDYQLVQRLAGSRWPEVRARLLQRLEGAFGDAVVAIYLYEGMLPQAMAAFDRSPYGSSLDQVVEATRALYPDWGIRHYRRRAEAIMEAGKAQRYDEAAEWLRRAREIYLMHGRQAEWRAYLDGLLTTHARKYKLVPLLRQLM